MSNPIAVFLSSRALLSASVSFCSDDKYLVGEKDRMFAGSSMLAGIEYPNQWIEVHDVVLQIAAKNAVMSLDVTETA